MFTPSARAQLLELVAEIRDLDRDRAARLIDAVEARLESLADGAETGRAVTLDRAHEGTVAVSLSYWVRAGVLWVLALMPEPSPSFGVPA